MSRWGWLAVALLAAGASAAPAAPPRCEVEAEVVPARGFVGQQLHFRLRILRRRDVGTLEWATPLSFPTFRSEWLPGLTGDAAVEREGESWLVFVERRALFPAHAGRLRIPAAALRCASPDGEEIVPIPPLEVEVDALPAEGQPADFAGLLGPVEVTATPARARIALGESLRVSVLVQGDTNLWNTPSPRPAFDAPELEVFEHPAELARDAGRGLLLRRYFAFDLVPRRAGVLRLPEIRIPYFDPTSRHYAEARARIAPIEVREAAFAPAPEPAPRRAASAARAARSSRYVWLAAVGASALLAGGLAVAARLRWRRRAAPSAAEEIALWLAAARDAERRGDRDAAASSAGRALRAALAAAPALAAEEIAARHPDAGPAHDAAQLLARLERARFSAAATAPPLAEVEASIERLRC